MILIGTTGTTGTGTHFFFPCYLSFKKICLPLQASTANSCKRLPTEAGLVPARVIPWAQGGSMIFVEKYNKRLLLFGIALKCRKFQKYQTEWISRKRLCDMHGRDLSGLMGILQPQSMGEKSSMLFCCRIPSPKISNTHQCIAYGQQES